jgi:hypothetical protein
MAQSPSACVKDGGSERVSRGDDDCARARIGAGVNVCPLVAEPSHREYGAVCCADVVGLLTGRRRPPFVIATCRDQAATMLEGGAKHGLGGHRLGAGVEGRGHFSSGWPPLRRIAASIVVVGAML